MLLNKDEMAALKKKSETEEAMSPGGKTTDFAGVTLSRDKETRDETHAHRHSNTERQRGRVIFPIIHN